MQPRLNPRESANRFAYEGANRLYRDHLGRRVIADVEGFGFFAIQPTLVPLHIEVDEVRADLLTGRFGQSFLVAAREPGPVDVRVYTGRIEPPVGPVETVGGTAAGAGWVIECASPLVVDDSHRLAPQPAPGFPVPFFRDAEGEGDMKIIRAPVACEFIDGFDIDDEAALKARNFKVQNISALSALESCFEDGERRLGPVASHLNAASWTVDLPAACDGLILRRLYDRFHGRQRSRVFIDGHLAGWWYDPAEDRTCRWAVSDHGVSAEHVQGKSELTITIDPPAGSALWSVSRLEIFALKTSA